jgi:hypothetical protein
MLATNEISSKNQATFSNEWKITLVHAYSTGTSTIHWCQKGYDLKKFKLRDERGSV